MTVAKRNAAVEDIEKLAAEYGVGRNAIWLIISGRSWKEV